MKRVLISFLAFFYSLCTYALTGNEGVTFIEKYYRLLSEYATTAENITLAKRIEGMHVGNGYVYPDVEINLGHGMTEVEGVGIKTVYLASIMSRQNLLLKFVPESIILVSNTNGICTMEYQLFVYSGNEKPGEDVLKYSVPLRMEIQNKDKKIRSILKRKKSTPPQYTLSVNPSSLSFDASGGSRTITVSSNTKWSVSISTASWGHLTRNDNTLTLQVDPNTGTKERTDYFKIKAGDKEERISITQSAPSDSSQPAAQIKSISVSTEQDLNDGKGIIIHVAFNVQNMKDKDGRVTAYFYDNDGTALTDNNDKYSTTNGKVAAWKDIKPGYDRTTYSDLQLKIPYSELHLSGSHSRTLKFFVSIWNNSVTPNKEFCISDYTTFSYTPTAQASFLNPSQTSVSVSHTGGVRNITISADGPWEIGIGTASWIDLSRSGNTIKLDISENPNTDSRNDYFTVKAGSLEKRITINQSADNTSRNSIQVMTEISWMMGYVNYTGLMVIYSNNNGIFKLRTPNVIVQDVRFSNPGTGYTYFYCSNPRYTNNNPALTYSADTFVVYPNGQMFISDTMGQSSVMITYSIIQPAFWQTKLNAYGL